MLFCVLYPVEFSIMERNFQVLWREIFMYNGEISRDIVKNKLSGIIEGMFEYSGRNSPI